ncbi:MAG: S41 family peptidase [Bacteroidia bacterium]|nr:S41 family peptidase [Bacteroidia bacterium]
MKHSLYLSTGLLILTLMLTSCEALFIRPDRGTTPAEIFEEAWTFADQEYSFFGFKNINWEEVRTRYETRIQDSMTDEALFEVIADMLYELRDGHVNLSSDFNVSRNWTWYLNSPPNFNYSVLERGYFKQQETFTGSFVVYDFGDVGYIRYSAFTSPISEADLDYVLTKFRDHTGIIIDIRDNGGGALVNATNFARRFTDQEVVVGSWRFKNGPGHEDFTDLEDIRLTPPDSTGFGPSKTAPVLFTGKVAVLTNRSSYSAANFFPMYMKALPNVTLVGDTTGGGGGAPANTELANGWGIRVSASQLFDDAGVNVEDGIPPDVQVNLDPADEANLVDTILERALALIRQ